MAKSQDKILENKVENYLAKKCIEHDFLYYKFLSQTTNGVPDRIIIGKNKLSNVIFVELKAPDKKPQPLQKVIIKEMKDHGATVFVIDRKEQVDELFEMLI